MKHEFSSKYTFPINTFQVYFFNKEDTMVKIKMLLLVHQIEGMLKGTVHRKSEYVEMKKILDSIRNRIFEAKNEIL